MEIEGSQEIHLDPQARGCIDDDRFSENQADITTCDLSEALDAQKEVDLDTEDHDLLPELHKSREADRTRTKGKYNLRKSLAWDSAFFTSAGVLDAEELSSMITGADKGKKQFLPGIQEDVTASTESISSLETENVNLETLEEELFVDIRASIQRSNKKVPNLTNSIDKKANVEVDSTPISSLKNEGVSSSSQDKNPKPGSRRITGLETVTTSKSLAKQNVWKQGSRKVIKQDLDHSQVKSTAKIAEKNPTLGNAPKAISNSISTSATVKRDSTGIGRGKSERASSKLGALATTFSKGTQPPKVSVGAGRMLPRPAASSKSSLLNSSTTGRVQSARSSTSSDSSHGLSSGAPPKSLTGRRIPSGSSNAVAGPCSIPKTLSRTALRNKPSPSISSPRLTSKVSSSASPASSISDWSSVSSSTSSMVIRKFTNSRTSLDTSSSKSANGETVFLPSRNLSTDQTSGGHENRKVNISNSISSKTSTTGTVQTSTKPTGLRMPSPKIGFFDGVKSSPRTPNGHKPSQPSLRTVIPKNGAPAGSPSRISSGKLKGVKAPTSRMSTSSSSSKPDPSKVTSIASTQEKSHTSINSSSVSLDVKGSLSLSHRVKGYEHGDECQKAEKVQVDGGVKQVVDEGTDDIVKEISGDLDINDSMVPEDIHGMHAVSPQKESATSCPSQICNGKQNVIKSPTTRMTPSLANTKLDSPNVTSLASSQEKSHDSINSSSVSWDVKGSPNLFLGVEGKEPEKECQKAEKVQGDDGVKQVVDACTDAIVEGNLGNLIINDFMVPEDIPGLHTALPKNESAASSPNRTSNTRLKGMKFPTRMSPSLASSKSDSPKVSSSTPSQAKLHASRNSSSVSLDAIDSLSLSLGVKGNEHAEECQKTEKVQVDYGVKQVVDPGTDAIVKGNIGGANRNNFMVPEDILGRSTMPPKNGAAASSPSTSSSKVKAIKSPTTRTSPSPTSSKPYPPKVTSPVSTDEKSHASINPSVSLDVKDSPSLPIGVKGNEPEVECQRAEKVQVDDGVKQVVDAGIDAIVKGNLGNLIINDFMVPDEILVMCTALPENEATASNPSQNTTAKLGGIKSPTNRISSSPARSQPDSLKITSLTFSLNSSPVSLDVKDSPTLPLGVKGNGPEEECQEAEIVQVDGMKQVLCAITDTVQGKFGDLNVNDLMAPVDIQKDILPNQNSLENNSYQTCHATTEKENTDDRYQGEGIIGAKYVCGPKNELYCEEYDTGRPPFALKNQVFQYEYIDGSRELDAHVAFK